LQHQSLLPLKYGVNLLRVARVRKRHVCFLRQSIAPFLDLIITTTPVVTEVRFLRSTIKAVKEMVADESPFFYKNYPTNASPFVSSKDQPIDHSFASLR
jgi:hypothetical protein